jgi:hypothetical protein
VKAIKKTAQSWRVSAGLSALTPEPAQQKHAGKPKNQTLEKKNPCKPNNQ